MRSDGLLPYEFVEEPGKSEVTGHAGLLPYIDLACVLGMLEAADEEIGVCGSQGWKDRDHALSLALLNLAGGECVEDIRMLETDPGICKVFGQAQKYGLSRGERLALEARFRKGRGRTFPSCTRLYEYLNAFHDPAEEEKRVEGQAFIPRKNEHLVGLGKVNKRLTVEVARHAGMREATLDIDAALVETHKDEARYSYKGSKAYQPITTLWAETGLAVWSEFRDGNVPAGHEMLRVVKESIDALPPEIEKIRIRTDSAGYQHDVLKFCATGDGGKRDPIEFTISNDMTEEFRQAAMATVKEDWETLCREGLATGQEWAEVVYVPNAIAFKLSAPQYRYIAIREPLRQGVLPGMDGAQGELDLGIPTIVCEGKAYKISGIVTNIEGDGAEVINWHRKRCGAGEEIHAVMKTDLAGGTLPSGKFGANAAWWGMMVLAYNLHIAMMLLALPGGLKKKRLKRIRFALIDAAGRVVERGRQLYIRLSGGHPALDWLIEMRRKIATLSPCPV
ncbi:MAG: IS1380 family transposase [Chloroflexota bacterium]